jgi:hypothetical protein
LSELRSLTLTCLLCSCFRARVLRQTMFTTAAHERLAVALADAVPCLIRDVRPLIAQYAVARWADWDFAGCVIDSSAGRRFTVQPLSKDGKSDERTVPTPAAMSLGWGPTLTEGRTVVCNDKGDGFIWLVPREPLGVSGLHRWAVRIDDNSCTFNFWFGVTGVTATNLPGLPDDRSADETTAGGMATIALSTYGMQWHSSSPRGLIVNSSASEVGPEDERKLIPAMRRTRRRSRAITRKTALYSSLTSTRKGGGCRPNGMDP